jgi:adenine deaminase
MLRLDNGFWVMVRHSSLRRDARSIVSRLIEERRPLNRVMLTTDGPVAADLVGGHLDVVVREAIAGGSDPVDAVRMATINPSTYLGLDAFIGSISPGRWADVLLVSDLAEFKVESVLVGGRPPTCSPEYPGNLRVPPIRRAPVTPSLLRSVAETGPAVRMEGILTRVEERPLRYGGVVAALVARDGSWIVGMVLTNVKVDALVSSFTGGQDILLLGSDTEKLAALYDDLVRQGSGILSSNYNLPLPLLGVLSMMGVAELAEHIARLGAAIQLPADVPLEFALLFMALGVLPDVRLTPGGVLEVKSGEILARPLSLG